MAVKSRLSREVLQMVTKEERDAWTVIYRLYEKYAGILRESDGEAADALLCTAMNEIQQYWKDSPNEGKLIMLAGYELLRTVWKESH